MPAEVVTAPIRQPDPIAQIIVLIVQYWVFIVLGFVALIIIVTIILLLRKMKKHIDPFAEQYKRIKALCRFQRDPTMQTVWLMNEKGIKNIGKYLGESMTQDGYHNIEFWKGKKWYLFWFPARLDFFDLVKEVMIIRCNVNNEFRYVKHDTETNKDTIETIKIAKDLVVKNEDKLIIKAFGLERARYFLYPVLRDKEGNTIDKTVEIFEKERNVSMLATMYQQAEDFANVSRELINLNPSARFKVKTGELPNKQEE